MVDTSTTRRPAVTSRLFSSRLLHFSALTGLLLLLAVQPGHVPAASPAAGGPARVLAEPDLAGGAEAQVLLSLRAGWYCRLRVDQSGGDVAARLVGPDGRELVRADGPGGRKHPEILPLVAPSTGRYRLVVTARAPARSGRCRIVLEELRPAKPGDLARVAAERALAESKQWHARASFEGAASARALSRALELAQGALRRWRSLGDPAGQIEALNHLGTVHSWLGPDIKAARASFQEAMELSVRSRNRRGEAIALRGLGQLESFHYLKVDDGLRHLHRSLAVWQELREQVEQVPTLQSIGAVHLLLKRDPRTALVHFGRALALARAAGAWAEEPDLLNAMGAIYLARGENARALAAYQRALALSRRAGDLVTEAAALQGMGSLYQSLGDLQAALETFRQALEMSEELHDSEAQLRVLNSLGTLYREMGDPGLALQHLGKALEILPPNAPERAETLFLMGRVHYFEDDLEQAQKHFAQALLLSSGSSRAAVLFGMGLVRRSLGSPAEALPLLEEALAIRRKSGKRLQEASVLLEIGRTCQLMGQMDRAFSLMEQALAISRRVGGPLVEAAALFRLAQLERDRGDLTAGKRRIDEALERADLTRSKLLIDSLRSSFFASRREHYELAIDLRMRLAEREPGAGHEAEAFLASESARGRGLLDLMAEGRMGAGRELPRPLREREIQVDARLSQVQNLLIRALSAEPSDPARIEALRRDLQAAEEQRQDLEGQIRREHRRYAQVRYGEPLSLAKIQPLLDQETALLEYVLGEEASFLFVVTREGMTTHRLPPARRIERLVQRARSGLESPSRRLLRSYTHAARGLYDALIAPARGALAGKRHLLVAADRSLHLLAFETLLSGDGGEAGGRPAHELPYLVRDHAVTYVPSATVWAELMESRPEKPAPAGAAKRLLAVADPLDLAGPPAGRAGAASTRAGRGVLTMDRWNPDRLAGTREEVRRISDLYPSGSVVLYMGDGATEERLKGSRWLSTAHRLHFATHGHISEARPELSALQLTRTQGSREDGLLQAHEIFDLRLAADLVVLSACETALGKEVTGEGLMGLTRAFLYAGADSLVVSLWPVADDAATPDLMVSFYRRLDRSGDKSEALQAAKLELIRKKQYAHPYYWAPFILVGEPE